MHTRLFIVDDDVHTAHMLCAAVEAIGFDGHVFTCAREFIAQSLDPDDIILLDLKMPDMDGIEVIRILARNKCRATLVLVSGHDKGVLHSAEKLARAHALNVAASLTKPLKIGALQTLVQEITQRRRQTVRHQASETLLPSVEELRQAIQDQQLVLHYQPQVDLKSGALSGVEALVRWQHPERGLIYPDRFIALAEQNGLIVDLTSQVIAQAIEQNRAWQNKGLRTRVSVNISADSITSLTLPEQLSDMFQNQNLDPTMLTFEVTESALMGELVTSLDVLTRLRMKGFGLSIDDFGTGYSSLSQLHRIPFTELKIDQSFIMAMSEDKEARSIVKTCIMLGHELNMEVVAEGVESKDMLDMLTDLGCDIAQGYYIARPMPADSFASWV